MRKSYIVSVADHTFTACAKFHEAQAGRYGPPQGCSTTEDFGGGNVTAQQDKCSSKGTEDGFRQKAKANAVSPHGLLLWFGMFEVHGARFRRLLLFGRTTSFPTIGVRSRCTAISFPWESTEASRKRDGCMCVIVVTKQPNKLHV